MGLEFSEVITTEAQFRGVIGSPNHRVLRKQVAALDDHCRAFIAKSPFLLISSCDGKGNMEVSPKGDPPGFVRVLDDETLAIPDRPGNRRADTFSNLLANPNVGLLFLVPGITLAGGSEPGGDSPEEFAAFLRAETDKYGKLIKATGIKIE